jgi:adenylosuccinate synthase
MKTAILTVGLGFGDEGKGATVDFLCRHLGADLVVRYSGGSQAAHGVVLPDGRRHVFSQFGAGTLAGVPTYLGPQVIISPTALAREADHLETLGVADPFATLSVHPDALVATFFHQALNRLKEAARGDGRHGSCGHGIGEARSGWLRHGSDAVQARDLKDRSALRRKLELLRQRTLLDLQEFAGRVPVEDAEAADLLGVAAEEVADRLLRVGERVRLAAEVPACEIAVFEGAQGVLLDEWYGFHPHTTWSTVTPHHGRELAQRAKAGRVVTLGITRAFTTRHGAGPLPTHDPALTARLADPVNPWNRWQGALRVGWLDLVLLRYAVEAAGPLDGLAVTWLDHAEPSRVCTSYEGLGPLTPPALPDLARQEGLNRALATAVPVARPVSRSGLLDLLGELAPVAVEAHGPTFRDRRATMPGLLTSGVQSRRTARPAPRPCAGVAS